MIMIGNVQDSGKYTCELDSDEDDPLSVTHTLQILGEKMIMMMVMMMVMMMIMIVIMMTLTPSHFRYLLRYLYNISRL